MATARAVLDGSNAESSTVLDSASVFSQATTLAPEWDSGEAFTPGRAIAINSNSIRPLWMPQSNSDFKISVTLNSPDSELAYTSKRSKRGYGNHVLSAPGRGNLVVTLSEPGIGKEPKIALLAQSSVHINDDDENEDVGMGETDGAHTIEAIGLVTTKGKWTSRARELKMPDGHIFEWQYLHDKFTPVTVVERENNVVDKRTRLALRDMRGKKIVAMLVRSDETITPGMMKCMAGVGGLLVFDAENGGLMDEALVVSSCIMMLMKEKDRRRAFQLLLPVLTGDINLGGRT